MQINKPAIEKMKNGTEGVEWLIYEALFKLGRNQVIAFYQAANNKISMMTESSTLLVIMDKSISATGGLPATSSH